eukprot:750609-Hanusia_phi.AAC.1
MSWKKNAAGMLVTLLVWLEIFFYYNTSRKSNVSIWYQTRLVRRSSLGEGQLSRLGEGQKLTFAERTSTLTAAPGGEFYSVTVHL